MDKAGTFILTPEEQVKIDNIIQKKGLLGIGYYTLRSYCLNCNFHGVSVRKLGEGFDYIGNFCSKCGCEDVIRRDM